MNDSPKSERNSVHRSPKAKRALGLAALALLGPMAGSANALAAPQDEVARIVMAAPPQTEFTVRATLPVPRNEIVGTRPTVALSVVDSDGTIAPTQLEAVTRYANPSEGIDVVEVIARVHRPNDVVIGSRMEFSVIRNPHAAGTLHLPATVQQLLDSPGSLRLGAKDVFGNSYAADLLRSAQAPNARTYRDGQLLKQVAGHEILLPVNPKDGPQGTLPHMMGVKTFVTAFNSEQILAVDIVVHNGMDGRSANSSNDDLLDDLYFRNLTLRVPAGWHIQTAFGSPFLGDEIERETVTFRDLVAGLPGGKMHFMPRQARFVKRIMLSRDQSFNRSIDVLKERHLAFCRPGIASDSQNPLWSWWNRNTARYYPQRQRLPLLLNHDLADMATRLRVDLAEIAEQFQTGSTGGYPFESVALGWAHPWGAAYGGMTGGDEINMFDGVRTAVTGSSRGYRLAQAIAKSYMDRQPTALYGLDGEPTPLENLLVLEGFGAPYLGGTFFLRPTTNNGDWFGFGEVPQQHSLAVRDNGLTPPYEPELRNWSPIDAQHLIRFTRNFKTLVWLGNDALSKETLVATFHNYRNSYHEFPNGAYGFTQSSGLIVDINHVTEFPGQGLGVGRAQAWGLDTTAAAYAVADDQQRAVMDPWIELVIDTIDAGQSDCTGNIMSQFIHHPDYDNFLVRQSREIGFLDQSLLSVKESVYEGRDGNMADQVERMVIRSVQSSIEPPFWSEATPGPWVTVPTGTADLSLNPDLCFNVPPNVHSDGVDLTRYWNSLAYAYRLTGSSLFLHKATQMTEDGSLAEEFLSGHFNLDIEALAGMIALIEELHGQD